MRLTAIAMLAGIMLALSGCGSSSSDNGDGSTNLVPNTPGATAGTGAAPGTGAQPGNTATNNGSGAAATAGTGATDTTGNTAGAASTDTTGNTAGAGSTDTGAAGASAAVDPSSFFTNCESGGANWGTPQQAGPCASGVTLYGVNIQFGPYGASSEYNVGQGYENAINILDNDAGCSLFIDGFAADPVGSADLKNIHDLDLALYTVFYPGVMPEGETFPLITWGNGTCAMPEGYGTLLRYVASHGYIIVAANSRYTGDGTAQTKGLDFMLAENEKQGSKYYHKIDTTKIGAMGHSQGGQGTSAASSDSRISSVIIWNGGTASSKPALMVSGDMDIFTTAASQLKNPVDALQYPGAWLFFHDIPASVDGSTTGGSAGHLTLMMEPERVTELTVAWWDMMLKGKADAKQWFLGDSCTLCNPDALQSMWKTPHDAPALEYGHNTMLQ